MRSKLEINLNEIDEMLLEMATLAEEMLNHAMKALMTQNSELAHKVIAADLKVDELELRIEQKCLNTIALQNPLAGDLRKISAVLKIITDLERVGDYSVNIAEVVIELGQTPLFKPLEDLPRMGQIVEAMLHSTFDSYSRKSTELAKNTAMRDDEVDQLYLVIYKELLNLIHEDKTYMDQIISLLFIGRYLERTADHITNICERVIFSISGERVSY